MRGKEGEKRRIKKGEKKTSNVTKRDLNRVQI